MCVCTSVSVGVCVYVHMCMYVPVHACAHVCACAHMCMLVCVCICMCAGTCAWACAPVRMCALHLCTLCIYTFSLILLQKIMKDNYGKYIFIVYCFIIYAASDKFSTDVECKVDYYGLVIFEINLSNGYSRRKNIHPTFYYKNDKSIVNWRQEVDCTYVNENEKYKCAMHELTNKERSLTEKIADYEFKLSILQNTTITNITSMYFKSNKNITLAPWQTVNQITYCDDAYGVKYIYTNRSYNSINIEWIRFPLDVDFSNNFQLDIRIKGVGIDQQNYVDKSTCCTDDLCNYNFQSLMSCSLYIICLETKDNFGKKYQKKCRNVNTYCRNRKDNNTIKWQGILLCILGGIILMICVMVLWGMFNKHTFLGAKFTNKNSQHNVINQEDLINPKQNLNNIHHLNNQHIYHYPYPIH